MHADDPDFRGTVLALIIVIVVCTMAIAIESVVGR